MSKRLLDFDAFTGLKTFHEYDHQTKITTISYEGDSTAVLERNKQFRNNPEVKKQGIKQSLMPAASIPPEIQIKWLFEEGLDVMNKDHAERLRKKLNSPEWKYLKLVEGTI